MAGDRHGGVRVSDHVRVQVEFPDWFGDNDRDYGYYNSQYEYISGNRDWDALWEEFRYEEATTIPGGFATFDLPLHGLNPACLSLVTALNAWLIQYARKLAQEALEGSGPEET